MTTLSAWFSPCTICSEVIIVLNAGAWLLLYQLKKLDILIQPQIPFQRLKTNLLPLVGDRLFVKQQRSPRAEQIMQRLRKADNISTAERRVANSFWTLPQSPYLHCFIILVLYSIALLYHNSTPVFSGNLPMLYFQSKSIGQKFCHDTFFLPPLGQCSCYPLKNIKDMARTSE